MYPLNIIKKIRKGYFTALYFNRTRQILFAENNFETVTVQVFQKNANSVLCGIPEVLELFRAATGYFHRNKWIDKFNELSIEHLPEGTVLNSREPVMHITGPYVYFCHLESLYLGILARRTLVATNARNVTNAAKGKDVICFADRFDHFLNQEGDGYAAHVGGIKTVCTDAQASMFGGRVAGTIPHALIAVNYGNTLEASRKFHKYIKGNLVVLVDFDNDVIKTSLDVARKLGTKLWGVRVDTSENMIDRSLAPKGEKGVNPTLVKNLRRELDANRFKHVKIIVSGGFNTEKIAKFEKEKTPVDVYGVGSSLLKGANDFTADIVKVENKLLAKEGRAYKKLRI